MLQSDNQIYIQFLKLRRCSNELTIPYKATVVDGHRQTRWCQQIIQLIKNILLVTFSELQERSYKMSFKAQPVNTIRPFLRGR